MANPFSWRCPFCSQHATITDSHYSVQMHQFAHGYRGGTQGIQTRVITCPNPACREYSLGVTVHDYVLPKGATQYRYNAAHDTWQLVPAAEMQVLPIYVPPPIVADYKEACLIRDLSPKASATLSRRCLQGMIRDFWGIATRRLIDDIEALKDKVDPLTWEAIDAVRSIGNIGAHMEKDINVVVDVDPDEAKLLLGLIETLIEDWYVARHDRQERLTKLAAAAAAKDLARKTKD